MRGLERSVENYRAVISLQEVKNSGHAVMSNLVNALTQKANQVLFRFVLWWYLFCFF